MLAGPHPRYSAPGSGAVGRDGSGTADAEADGDGEAIHAGDAFALLGNRTRMDVLRTLWEAREPFTPVADSALSFSELRERAGVDDPGQFNYHLNQLVGPFVRRTDEGYVLRPNVTEVLRTVVTGSVTGADRDLRAGADDPCPLCGAGVEVVYSNPTLTVRCTSCPGVSLGGVAPEGTLVSSSTFPPLGLGDRTGQELWDALFTHLTIDVVGLQHRVCPRCAAPTATAVDACPGHDRAGICGQCGSSQAAVATMRCGICTAAWRFPAWVTAMTHPDVVAFFHERGLDAVGGVTLDVYAALLAGREDVHSTDPLELAVTVEVDGDQLAVTVDETLRVVDVRT